VLASTSPAAMDADKSDGTGVRSPRTQWGLVLGAPMLDAYPCVARPICQRPVSCPNQTINGHHGDRQRIPWRFYFGGQLSGVVAVQQQRSRGHCRLSVSNRGRRLPCAGPSPWLFRPKLPIFASPTRCTVVARSGSRRSPSCPTHRRRSPQASASILGSITPADHCPLHPPN
jgi:hypothetical protein